MAEEKADHFAKVNNEKFQKVWDLNTDSCQKVLMKISETDKILYEQQMGIQWVPPVFHVLKMKHLQSFKDAVMVTGECSTSQSIASTASSALGLAREKKTEEFQYKHFASLDTDELDENSVYKRLLKYILTHISDKSGFLTEKRLKELLTPYEDDQKTLVRLDNVFATNHKC